MRKLIILLLISIGIAMSKELEIKTDDGFILKGFLEYPTTKSNKYPIIIFVHQFGTTHRIWSEFAKKCRDKGYATFLIDLRGHGLSIVQNGKENKIVFPKNEDFSLIDLIASFKKSAVKVNFRKIPGDISLWIDYLIDNEKIDIDKIYLIGASLGGISIIPVVLEQSIRAIVSISPGSPAIMGEDIVNLALASYDNPLFFIASDEDPIGSGKVVLKLLKKSVNGRLLLLKGKGHGVILLDKAEKYIFTFLDEVK